MPEDRNAAYRLLRLEHLVQRVILINGQELADLIEHGVGVRSYRTVEFKRLEGDFFGEE